MRFQLRTLLFVVVVALSSVGCATTMLPMPVAKSTPPDQTSEVRAGVAEVDITPPIGLGLFGHGPEGRIAVGTELRLRCQVFVIIGAKTATKPSEAIALVPCDLSSPSLLLQRSIAERVQKKIPIGADNIVLAATHTHAAPGHFYGVKNYSGLFTSRLLGFDPRVLEFLVDAISRGLIDAYEQALKTPARIGWSQGIVRQSFTRNRNPMAFVHNDDAIPEWLVDRVKKDPLHVEEAAVDPTISVLRVDRVVDKADPKKDEPMGVFATFGTHPSALSNTQDMYSGDVFGYATRYVAGRVVNAESGPRGFVAGIANGIEGDVMPARTAASVRESRRFGHLLADEIFDRWKALGAGGTLSTDAAVRVAYRELSLPNAKIAKDGTAENGTVLCKLPELGTAMGAGASDHPTLLRVLPQFNAGVTAIEDEGEKRCASPKYPILLPSGEAEGGVDFPGTAPITVAQVGDHYVVALPAEVTTITGVRVREAVADALSLPDEATTGNPGRNVVVMGLANEYLQYVATREEYELQLYEGASTLYGPASAEFLKVHAKCLADWLRSGNDKDCRLDQESDVNAVGTLEYPELSDAELLSDDHTAPDPPSELVNRREEFTREGLLAYSVSFSGPQPERVRQRSDLWVQVYRVHGGVESLYDDDTGTSVSTRYDSYANEWLAIWKPDLVSERKRIPSFCDQQFKIVVGSGTTKKTSALFSFKCDCATELSKEWP